MSRCANCKYDECHAIGVCDKNARCMQITVNVHIANMLHTTLTTTKIVHIL